MRLVVASTFRDSVPYLDRYLGQVADLADQVRAQGDDIQFVWGENDSLDGTRTRLEKVAAEEGNVTVVDCSTGAPYYQSAETHSARWANVATYCNQTLDALPAGFDVLVWVESDLIWDPDTILKLAGQAVDLGVVAAPVWRGQLMYDTWGVRRDGEPYTPPQGEGLIRVDSACGCIAARSDLATAHRFPVEDACRGWVRDMGGVWLDTDVKVEHPR